MPQHHTARFPLKRSWRSRSDIGLAVGFIVAFLGCMINWYWLNAAERELRALLLQGVEAEQLPLKAFQAERIPKGTETVCIRGPYESDVEQRGLPLEIRQSVLDTLNAYLQREYPTAAEYDWNLIYVGGETVLVLTLDMHHVPLDYKSSVCVPFDQGAFKVVLLEDYPYGYGVKLGKLGRGRSL